VYKVCSQRTFINEHGVLPHIGSIKNGIKLHWQYDV